MKRILSGAVALGLLAGLALAGAGCTPEATSGTIEVWVTDIPLASWQLSILEVTVSDIEVNQVVAEQEQGGWLPLSITGTNPFDLRRLEYEEIVLARVEVPLGNYTQLRLNIDRVVVTYRLYYAGFGEEPGITVEAEITASQLEFVRPFNVVGGETTVLLLDFDVDKAVTLSAGDSVIFNPVVTLTIQQGQTD